MAVLSLLAAALAATPPAPVPRAAGEASAAGVGPELPLGPECPSKVMAFYYGWYGGPPEWRHWAAATDDPRFAHDPNRTTDSGAQYPEGVRRDIASTNYPALGPYDSLDEAVVDRHLAWARRAGIDVLVSSWWGPGSYEDEALRFLLDRIEATHSRVRVAVYLETWALFYGGNFQPGFFLDPRNFDFNSREQIRDRAAEWISYLLTTYGDHRSMERVRKGGAKVPVVFVYTAALFAPEEWQDIFARVRARTGRDAYYQGDVEGADFSTVGRAFDGIHVYNPAPFTAEGSLSLAARILDPNASVPFPASGLSDQATVGFDYAGLAAEARALGRSWAATVIPGFDDRRVRSLGFVVSRDRGGERTYDVLWREALASHPDWVLVTSFNEWHEGSEIEPSVEYGDEFLARTRAWADQVHACVAGAPGGGSCTRKIAGTGKGESLEGTRDGERIRGRGGADRIEGRGGPDCLAGNRGSDRVAGNGGPDEIEGGAGDDRLEGNGGADLILGGPGTDRIAGGPGADVIEVPGRGGDTVDCGPGRDEAVAGRGERVRGCERVRRR